MGVILFYLSLQIPFWYQGINGAHSWRQSDTASVARNFSRHPDFPSFKTFLFPRIDLLSLTGDPRGITGMEFPLYQAFVSLLFSISKTDHDFWGLLVSSLSGIAVILGILALFPSYRPSFVCLSLVSIPIFIKWGHKFMPEMFSLALMIWGLYFYNKKSIAGYFLGGLLLLGGTLARPFVIFLNLPLLMDFIQGLKRKQLLFYRTLAPLSIGMAILVSLFVWYGIHSPYLVKKYGISYFATPIMSWEKSNIFLKPESYLTLSKAFFYQYANLIFLVPFLWGLCILLKEKKMSSFEYSMLGVIPLSLTVLSFLMDPNFLFVHPYYLVACIPAVVIVHHCFWLKVSPSRFLPIILLGSILAFILYCVLDKEKPALLIASLLVPGVFWILWKFYSVFLQNQPQSLLLKFCVCLFVVYVPGGWYLGQYVRVNPSIAAVRSARMELWQKTHPDDLFVFYHGEPSVFLYQLRRRGVPLSKQAIQQLLDQPTPKNFESLQKFGIKWILYAPNGNNYTIRKLTDLKPSSPL